MKKNGYQGKMGFKLKMIHGPLKVSLQNLMALVTTTLFFGKVKN